MKVNIAVVGRFHYHNYVPWLWRQGVLHRFYYSHRLDRRILPRSAAENEVNLFLKEYLQRLHGKLLGCRAGSLNSVYYRLWEDGVLARWSRADIWHVLLHGGARRILKRARSEGSRIIGEPVNAHPREIKRLLVEEAERLGIAAPKFPPGWGLDLEEEVESTEFLLTASRWIRRSFVTYGYPTERILVCPYGVDLEKFAPGRSDERNRLFRVLCVGHITPRKGQVDLLEAWSRLRLPQAELLLLGVIDESMRPVLERYSGLFRYSGYCSFDRVHSYYRQASVFVLPSIEDGFSVACLEAMASGLPVITTENTGAADVIDPGLNGFVVPIRSPEKIAEALEALYRNPELRRSMGENARRKARECLGWDRYARELVTRYGETLAESVSNGLDSMEKSEASMTRH